MHLKKASKLHIKADRVQVEFAALMRQVAYVIDQESASIAPIYDAHPNITLYREHAEFLDDHTLRVGNQIITAPQIIVAVGSDAWIPPIEGLDSTPYMTYREALRNEKLPDTLLVIGGGYIAAELGHFYSAMGSETHLFVKEGMLTREDDDVRKEFTKAFSKQVHIHRQTEVKKVCYHEGTFQLTYVDERGEEHLLEGDALLVATGMRPLTQKLGLENTHIAVDDRGYIVVDPYLQTTAPGVFALGDCIGRYGFRHSANYEGEYLFRSLFQGVTKEPIHYKPMPHAIFTHPQIASVGVTEEKLPRGSYLKGICRYENSAMGMALRSEEGFVKLLFDSSTHKLMGAHIVGEEAATMVHVLVMAMHKEATLEDLQEMIYVHPALPEVIRNAARQAR